MAVLADLGDQDTRAAALARFEFGDELMHLSGGRGGSDLALVDARDCPDLGLVAPIRSFERGRNFAYGGLRPRRVDREREQVFVAAGSRAGQRRERLLDRLR